MKQICKHELGEDNQLHTKNVFFRFDEEGVTLETGILQGGCVSTEAQWLSGIINKNLYKVKNNESFKEFRIS